LEIPRGKGVLKAKIFKGKYEPKLEFPEGWGVQTKKPLHGASMDMFWNNTLPRLNFLSNYKLNSSTPIKLGYC